MSCGLEGYFSRQTPPPAVLRPPLPSAPTAPFRPSASPHLGEGWGEGRLGAPATIRHGNPRKGIIPRVPPRPRLLLVTLATTTLLITARHLLLRRRVPKGFCPHCHYDLFATPDRSPRVLTPR